MLRLPPSETVSNTTFSARGATECYPTARGKRLRFAQNPSRSMWLSCFQGGGGGGLWGGSHLENEDGVQLDHDTLLLP